MPQLSRLRPLLLACAAALALPISGCLSGYPAGLAGLTVGGGAPKQAGASMPAVNSMSVPVCEVVVAPASAPEKTYVNDANGKVFLSPGETKDVSAPALTDITKPIAAGDLDKEGKNMTVTAYGCKKDAYDWTVDESAKLFEKDGVTFDRSQKLVIH